MHRLYAVYAVVCLVHSAHAQFGRPAVVVLAQTWAIAWQLGQGSWQVRAAAACPSHRHCSFSRSPLRHRVGSSRMRSSAVNLLCLQQLCMAICCTQQTTCVSPVGARATWLRVSEALCTAMADKACVFPAVVMTWSWSHIGSRYTAHRGCWPCHRGRWLVGLHAGLVVT